MYSVPAPFVLPRAGLPRLPPSAEMQRKGAPVQMRAATAPPRTPPTGPARQVIQRCGVQDLSGYAIKSPRTRSALAEIQAVLSDPARVNHWRGWLERQTREIKQRLDSLHPVSDQWISVYSDAARNEMSGEAMRRWKAKANKALDIALWRIERRWMKGLIRHTVTEDTGSSAAAFSGIAKKVGALKDVGAPLQHGEYPHRIQWYVIYRHLSEKGYSPDEVYAAYRETLKTKHTRVLLKGELHALDAEPAKNHDPRDQRSLWDRVVDIRLSERTPGLENAFWASPLAVTASYTPPMPPESIPSKERPVRPPKNLPPIDDFSKSLVGEAVYARLHKRKMQSLTGTRYAHKGGVPFETREQLNLGRELVNQSLAARLNLL